MQKVKKRAGGALIVFLMAVVFAMMASDGLIDGVIRVRGGSVIFESDPGFYLIIVAEYAIACASLVCSGFLVFSDRFYLFITNMRKKKG